MTGPPVVVAGLDCPTGLQTARIFAARGIEVIGVATKPRHPCARTRACTRVVTTEPGSEGVVASLLTISTEVGERPVLIPCTDLAVLGIARHAAELTKRFHVAVPPLGVVETLMDKGRFALFADRHGLPIPETYVVHSHADIRSVSARIGFPCVLKPTVKGVEWDRRVSAKAFLTESRQALLEAYHSHVAWADSFVVQRWIEGDDTQHHTVDAYVGRDGQPLVTFSSRKIRQWPPVIGQACLSVECRNDAVKATALDLLSKAGHIGQGYVETKWDARSQRHLIIEANVGRPTGRSAAAEAAGVELLMTLYCDLLGRPLPVERAQRFRGTKWIHIRRDVQACAVLLARDRIRLRDVIRSWRGRFTCALFSTRDPVPFLADLLGAFRSALTRGLARPVSSVPSPAEPEQVRG